MALEKRFTNTVADKKEKKKKITKLTVLTENDDNTIFNLIFIEKSKVKGKE